MTTDKDIIIMEQLETQAYINQNCGVTIKQLAHDGDHSVIEVHAEHIDALIAALKRLKGEALAARQQSLLEGV